MGLIHAEVQLSNPARTELDSIRVTAMADSGAMHLCIPQHVALQLKLDELEQREVTLADGSKQLIPYVGPLMVRFGNRSCFTGAMALGDEVLLGAIPMEDMDLVLHPATRSFGANPKNPNIPASVAKGMPPGTRPFQSKGE